MAGYGALIKEARAAEQKTQDELAEEIRVSRPTMANIESERVAIAADVYVRILGALRTLRPVELLEAMGFPVPVAGEATLPPEIVRALRPLRPADLAVIERIALGLQLRPATPPRTMR